MPQVIALVQFETDNPLLTGATDASDTADVRLAVLAALPRLNLILAVMPEIEARLMVAAHMMACQQSGMSLSDIFEMAEASTRRESLH